MSTDLKLERCAELLMTITDDIAAHGPRHARDASIPALIAQVREVSEHATRRMREALRASHPDFGWRGEDEAGFGDAGLYWVYDPIDGAYHYLQGLPLWSASLALVHNGKAVAALVYDPALRELFVASDGSGTWTGCIGTGQEVHVSPKSELAATVVGTAVPPLAQVGADEQQHALSLFAAVARRVFVVRPMAAASLQLAYVAAGRLDAYWETGNDQADWLAGALLVCEAGGIVNDLAGHALHAESRGIVAGNARLVRQLRAVAAG